MLLRKRLRWGPLAAVQALPKGGPANALAMPWARPPALHASEARAGVREVMCCITCVQPRRSIRSAVGHICSEISCRHWAASVPGLGAVQAGGIISSRVGILSSRLDNISHFVLRHWEAAEGGTFCDGSIYLAGSQGALDGLLYCGLRCARCIYVVKVAADVLV